MILCVSPNPAIDRSIVVPDFTPFAVNRSTFSMDAAGGKGINVARGVGMLGGRAVCAGFLGGDGGRRVKQLADAEGMESAWTWIEGETRTCIIIAEPNSGRATVVNDNGPTVNEQDWLRLQTDVVAAAREADCVCISGSVPPGSPPEAYTRLLEALKRLGVPVWVDTSGVTLRTALTVPGIGIKINHEELGAILGVALADAPGAVQAAQTLRERGAHMVVVTLGAPGAVIVHETGCWWAEPPTIHPVDSVGSGDSFLAGLTVALNKGHDLAEALRWAAAAGTANALSVGGGQFAMADFERILAETRITPL